MKRKWRFASLTVLSGILLFLLMLSALPQVGHATNNKGPNLEEAQSVSLSIQAAKPITSEIYIPIITRCYHDSDRAPLQNTGNFSGTATIYNPTSCTHPIYAETPIIVDGTASLAPNIDLWIMVYAHANDRYYPQANDACAAEKIEVDPFGAWQIVVYLGESGGSSELFDVVAILTDAGGTQTLINKLFEDCQDGDFDGMSISEVEALPATEVHATTLRTVD